MRIMRTSAKNNKKKTINDIKILFTIIKYYKIMLSKCVNLS